MILVIDDYILCDLLSEIRSPRGDQEFIPFVRFNTDAHAALREKGEGPYGALQFLGQRPDLSRAARSARIWKWTDGTKKVARVDRHPSPVFLDYQISLYTERTERPIAESHLELLRRLPITFYKTLQVDIFGDGALVDKAIHFVRGDAVYPNPLDQHRQFQVHIPYTVEAWIFFHSATDRATFWNRAEVSVCLAEKDDILSKDTVPIEQDDITLNP